MNFIVYDHVLKQVHMIKTLHKGLIYGLNCPSYQIFASSLRMCILSNTQYVYIHVAYIKACKANMHIVKTFSNNYKNESYLIKTLTEP